MKTANRSCSLHCDASVDMLIEAQMSVDERQLSCVNGDNCLFLEGFFVFNSRVSFVTNSVRGITHSAF